MLQNVGRDFGWETGNSYISLYSPNKVTKVEPLLLVEVPEYPASLYYSWTSTHSI